MQKTTVSGRRLVIVGGTLSVVVLFGVTFAFRTFGWTRFVANSQLQEGKSNVVYLARAVAACVEKTGKIPPTSHTVPDDLSQVGGKTFTSTEADWSDEAFACPSARSAGAGHVEGFRVRDPQRFQYQWERTSDHSGVARARADFNGDGIVEATFEQELDCQQRSGKLHCTPGAFRDRNH